MAARTSSQAGAWSDSATWGGSAAPGIGDTATIGHAVTVSGSVTVGTSPAEGNVVVTVNGTGGSLAIQDGATFVLRGDMALNNATLTIGAGCTFEFDASAASSPSSQNYAVRIGTGHNQASANVVINGTSGSRTTVRSNAGGGVGKFTDGTGPWLQGGCMTCTYTDFTNIGDSAERAMMPSLTSTGNTFSLSYCTLTSCGKIQGTYGGANDCNFILDYCTWVTTAATQIIRTNFNAAKTSGTRRVNGCVFDKLVEFYTPYSLLIQNSYFEATIETTDGPWDSSFANNFIKLASGNYNIGGDVTNSYWYHTGSSNNHYINALGFGRNQTVDGIIFEGADSSGDGDCIIVNSPASPCTLTVKNCLVLPNAGNECSGTIFSALGNSNQTISCNHNTTFSGSQGAAVGETYAGHTGMVSSFRSNIFWDDNASARGYKLFDSGSNDSVSNLVTAANANYNCGFGLLAGSNGKGYNNLEFSAGSPGANDIDENPNFVDKTRDLASWSASRGGAATAAAAIAAIKANTSLISDLVTWVKAGFKVQNANLNNAGHDGVTIGAMDYQAAAASGSTAKNRLLLGVG